MNRCTSHLRASGRRTEEHSSGKTEGASTNQLIRIIKRAEIVKNFTNFLARVSGAH